MEWKMNLPLEGRWLPVAIALRFDRVGRRELPPTTKRNDTTFRGGAPVWASDNTNKQHKNIKYCELNARSPVPSAAPGRQCKYFIFLIWITNVTYAKI